MEISKKEAEVILDLIKQAFLDGLMMLNSWNFLSV